MTDMPPRRSLDPQTIVVTPRRRRWFTALLAVLVVAGVAAILIYRPHTGGSGAAAKRGRPDTIPVLVAAAAKQDVPIFLDGLGTVQAFNTVTVHAQVDGTLIAVRFTEGQDVKAGDILAQIDPRTYQATLDQNIAKKAQDEATLANAKLDMARYMKLAQTAYTSAQTADTQRATVAQTEALVRQDQAQIDAARVQVGYTNIVAPIDGRTGLRTVDVGNVVHASDTTGLTVVTQLHPISVVFTLPQQELQAVTAAMTAGTAEVIAQVQGTGGAVLDRGTLAVLDNQVDSTTGTIKLKATFPNTDNTLWPGGFVGVRLRVRTEAGAVTVPPSAVQRGPRGAYVYVVKADKTAERRDVTVGHEDQDVSVISKGLQPGETVVTDGASRLTDGTKVNVTQPSDDATDASAGPQAPGTGRRTRHGGNGS